eukprot:m.264265 g.264265  ORF g.264265 m.264265 type:complete len:186 (+) comp16228_c0_seq57:176-733(+)
MTYANHAGTSWPKPEPVQEAVSAAMHPEAFVKWGTSFEECHKRVARFFGISDYDRLLLTPGCTSALNVGISDLPWKSGDTIFVSSLEHHALYRPAQLLENRGVKVQQIGRMKEISEVGDSNQAKRRHCEAPLDLEDLEKQLKASPVGSLRLVAMTAACNVSLNIKSWLKSCLSLRLGHRRIVTNS